VHRRPPWDPGWPELPQLCESGPFQAFCRSSLPSDEQRLICQSCGLPRQPSPQSELHPSRTDGGRCSAGCSRGEGENRFLSRCDLQPWEMPYVWELDNF